MAHRLDDADDLIGAEIGKRLSAMIVYAKRLCLDRQMLFMPENLWPIVRAAVITTFGAGALPVLDLVWTGKRAELFDAALDVTGAIAYRRAAYISARDGLAFPVALLNELRSGVMATLLELRGPGDWEAEATDLAEQMALLALSAANSSRAAAPAE